jgi:hypothetical protein
MLFGAPTHLLGCLHLTSARTTEDVARRPALQVLASTHFGRQGRATRAKNVPCETESCCLWRSCHSAKAAPRS